MVFLKLLLSLGRRSCLLISRTKLRPGHFAIVLHMITLFGHQAEICRFLGKKCRTVILSSCFLEIDSLKEETSVKGIRKYVTRPHGCYIWVFGFCPFSVAQISINMRLQETVLLGLPLCRCVYVYTMLKYITVPYIMLQSMTVICVYVWNMTIMCIFHTYMHIHIYV